MKEPDSCFRHDLGSCAGADEDNVSAKEFMPQIMWPSLYLKGGVEDSEVHQRIIQLARQGQISLEQSENLSSINPQAWETFSLRFQQQSSVYETYTHGLTVHRRRL